MAINNIKSMNQTFNEFKVKNWPNVAEFETHLAPELTENLSVDAKSTKTFGDLLANKIVEVNDVQKKADVAIQKLVSGKSKNIHQTMLAVEQAELAFKSMNQIRNKVLQAYKDVMNMQV